LAFVALHDLKMEKSNVKTAFLHGNLDEKIYMEQSLGFIEKGNE